MSQEGILNAGSASAAETLTGNTGGPVGPDGSNNINVVGTAPITVTGNPGTNTLTISDDGTYATTYTEDAGSATPAANNLNILGGVGCTTTGAGSTVTIDVTGGGFTWTEIVSTSTNMAVENGYIANNAALVTLTLPAVSSLGDTVEVVGKGAGLFRIAQNGGQVIHFIDVDTTTGVGGSLTAVERYASIELVCITANTEWLVTDSAGNFTVI